MLSNRIARSFQASLPDGYKGKGIDGTLNEKEAEEYLRLHPRSGKTKNQLVRRDNSKWGRKKRDRDNKSGDWHFFRNPHVSNEMDKEYMGHIKNRDFKNAQRMIMDVAKKSGFGDLGVTYHGTDEDFEEFDISTNIMTKALNRKMYFFSDERAVAATYIKKSGKTPTPYFLKMDNPLVIDAEFKDWQWATGKAKAEWIEYETPAEMELHKAVAVAYGKDGDHSFYEDYEDLPEESKNKINELSKKFGDESIKREDMSERRTEPISIYANWPKMEYDGIVIKNVQDVGGSLHEDYSHFKGKETAHRQFSNVICTPHPTHIKKASVTYDKSGKPIPLSKRFNPHLLSTDH